LNPAERLPQPCGGNCKPLLTRVPCATRKGAGAGNYVFIDAQDLGGVWKTAIRGMNVFILGVQRERNEVERTLDHIPEPRPKVDDVMTLERGWFYVCFGKSVQKVYVYPSWLSDMQIAVKVAKGEMSSETARIYHAQEPIELGSGQEEEEELANRELEQENLNLRKKIIELEDEVRKLRADALKNKLIPSDTEDRRPITGTDEEIPPVTQARVAERLVATPVAQVAQAVGKDRIVRLEDAPDDIIDAISSGNELYQRLRERLLKDAKVLQILAETPRIEVIEEIKTIQVDGTSLRGRLAKLILNGFFDDSATGQAAFNELVRLGGTMAKPSIYKELDKLATDGFVTKEVSGGYRAAPGVKSRIGVNKR
jgi:hypothetical protein